ncbi:MAG TPA: GspH/FimT family pseudopilin [Pseudoxanthomonas sp.]
MKCRHPRLRVTRLKEKAQGVSLLEMLLVMGLIAIAGTLAAMVLTGGLDGMRLRSSSKEIAAQLRYTRAQAIASGRPQRFVIDPGKHTWQAPNQKHGKIPASLSVQFIGAREAQPRAGEGGIMFFPDGASTGGRVQLQAKKAAWRIDVAWLTGEVRLARAQAEPLP